MHPKRKIAIAIALVYLILFPAAAYSAYRFLGNTKLEYKPPEGSLVQKSEANAAKFFPNQIMNNPLFLLFENVPKGEDIVSNADFQAFSEHLVAEVDKKGTDIATDVISLDGYWMTPPYVGNFRAKFIGGTNNDTSLVVVSVADGKMEDTHDRIRKMYEEWIKAKKETFTMKTTSVDSITQDLEKGIVLDLVKIDAISMPIAIGCLCYCLRSVRMAVIPGITVLCTIVYAFAVLYPISLATVMSSFAPEMSAAVMSSISIDYALFILSRFMEQVKMQELAHGKSEETKWLVVKKTTMLSAHNILVSGLTIAAALGGLAILPIPFLATIGIAFCVGACSAVFIAMTLMPSLLLIFYDFFSIQTDCGAIKKLCVKDKSKYADADAPDEKTTLVPETLQEHDDLERTRQYNSIWFKIGSFSNHRPFVIALLVLAVGAPFFYYASTLKVDFDLFHQVPRDSPHAAVLKTITTEVGHGATTPFYITFTTKKEGGILNNDVFHIVNNVTKEICDRTGQPLDRLLSFSYVPLFNMGFIDATTAEGFMGIQAYQYLFNKTVSENRQAGLVGLYTTFDPFSSIANDYLNKVHEVIESADTKDGLVEIGLLGASADSWSIMRKVMELFPIQIGITFAVIFLFIAIVFRSAFIPFRMVFTVAYTVAFAFGFGVLLFQFDGIHKIWTALQGVQSYSWTVPIMAFSLLCALALDYDVFLLTRIIEYKRMGFNNEAAISKAVWKTGRIISFAGIIMSITFGSLMFSNTTMLNQFGAISSFAVLLDTFVVRPFFVPALMSIIPALSFWPRKFAREDRDVDDMGELLEDASLENPGGASWWT